MLLLEILDLSTSLHKVSLLVFGLLLEVFDVAELVHGEDVVVWRSDVVFEEDAVLRIV